MSHRTLDADALRGLPLPWPEAGSKEDRGSVLVLGGCREVPGGALLAGLAALRVGAGKLKLATSASVAVPLALAIPEAMVTGLPETQDGGIVGEAAVSRLEDAIPRCAAVLIGPGMNADAEAGTLVRGLLGKCTTAAYVLDAGAISGLTDHAECVRSLAEPAILTPHAGEMASLLGREREAVEAEPDRAAREAAERLRAVVVMKGAETLIVAPDGASWRYAGGGVGLATSGSGDVLAGLITGLRARGADPVRAALWGVYLHGEAGASLAKSVGPLGFLAREISGEVPRLLREIGGNERG